MMTRKISAIVLCAVGLLCVFILAGCTDNHNDAVAGQWTPSTVSINGEQIQFSELEAENKDFCFTFEKNGKCKAVLAGIANEGTYVFNETSVDITYGGKTQKLVYSNGTLTLNFYYNNETTSFVFTKDSK